MRERLEDIFYSIKDKLEEFWWWIQDNVKLFIILVTVSAVCILFFFGYRNATTTETDKVDYFSKEHLTYLDKNSDMINKMFLNLDEDSDYQILGASNSSFIDSSNNASLIYNLYVRKPFTDADTIENTLNTFLDMVKLQTKAEGYDLKLVKFNLYFRKGTYKEGLDPDGSFKYMLDYKKLDIEKLQKENKYASSSVEAIAENETSLATKVRPKNYTTYFEFEALTTDSNLVALTDEEFEAYLKFDKYVALAGGFNAGVKLYLQWELGANVQQNPYLNISDQFKEFKERLGSTGEKTEYFSDNDNLIILESNLLVSNPQLLLFAKDGVAVKDPTEARKMLLEGYADDFQSSLVGFTEKQGTMYTEYNKVYEPASNDFISNMTNSQKIANGYKDSKGLPLNNIDYDSYFKGEIDMKGNVLEQDDEDDSNDDSEQTTQQSSESE